MGSGMEEAGASQSVDITMAAVNEAAIAAADPAVTVVADGARAGADMHISRSSMAAPASAAHTHAHMHTCMYACMHTCTCIYTCMYICIHARARVHVHVYTYVCMYV